MKERTYNRTIFQIYFAYASKVNNISPLGSTLGKGRGSGGSIGISVGIFVGPEKGALVGKSVVGSGVGGTKFLASHSSLNEKCNRRDHVN